MQTTSTSYSIAAATVAWKIGAPSSSPLRGSVLAITITSLRAISSHPSVSDHCWEISCLVLTGGRHTYSTNLAAFRHRAWLILDFSKIKATLPRTDGAYSLPFKGEERSAIAVPVAGPFHPQRSQKPLR